MSQGLTYEYPADVVQRIAREQQEAHEQIAALEKERDALREALQEIAGREPADVDPGEHRSHMSSMDCYGCEAMIEVARQALAGATEPVGSHSGADAR